MREIVNYMLEANASLLVFLLVYVVLLRDETNFTFNRLVLLSSILCSLLFPLLSLGETGSNIVSASTITERWLPEVIVSGGKGPLPQTTNTAYTVWQLLFGVYISGLVVSIIVLVVQLRTLFRLRADVVYAFKGFNVFESDHDVPCFSFFKVIYIGNRSRLSDDDKRQILEHEIAHASRFHSFDILVTTLMHVFFWFNPCIIFYKRIFVRLHEFEADARAVEESQADNYCALLARVALQSVHFPIASHFNQSLTLKRIAMIRTQKHKLRIHKYALIATAFVISFYFVACNDQIATELEKSTITQIGDYPDFVKADRDNYLKEHKEATLTYMEGMPEEIDRLVGSLQGKKIVVNTYAINSAGLAKKGVLLSNVTQFADQLTTGDKIYMVTEEAPEFNGGYGALVKFLQDNLKYPEQALKAGKSGTVYVSMVINEDGSVSDATVLRGVEPSLDAESARVVSIMPPWKPGRQDGKAVKVRFNLPIRWAPQAGAEPK